MILEKFGDDLSPGDIYILNNPFDGGTHYNDVGIIKPIYVNDELFAFAISISHWTDVGGKSPGSLPADATEIFQEGICFPGLLLYKDDKPERTVFEMVEANVRMPKMALGDLNAAVASVRIADKRCQELCEKYDSKSVSETFQHILSTSEAVSRRRSRGTAGWRLPRYGLDRRRRHYRRSLPHPGRSKNRRRRDNVRFHWLIAPGPRAS